MNISPKNIDDLNLNDALKIIKKRKWFLIVFILAVTLGTALYSFNANPIYEAKARVLVNLEKPSPVNLTNNPYDDFKGDEFFETQVALIKSRSLIKNIIKQLKLTESTEFQSEHTPFLNNLNAWFNSLATKLSLKDKVSESIEPDTHSLLIDQIMERLQVKQIKSSRVLEISFQGKSPPLVAEITNALTHEYMVKTLEWYSDSDGNTESWVDDKLRDLNIKLKNSENKLRQFKLKKNFIEVKEGRDLVLNKWNEISKELTKAASVRLRLETQIQELKALRNDPLKLLLSQPFLFNANLSELQKKYIDVNNELSSLLRSKTPQHPDVVLLTQKLNLLNQRIPSEVDNFLTSLTINFKAALNQEKALENALKKQQNTIMKTDDDFLQFRFLKQEVELNEKLYNEILNRKKELAVNSNFNSSNISIVDSAEVPYFPVKPRKGLNIILAMLISTFVGFMLIFFQESQDKSFKTEEDFEDNFPYLVFGSVASIPKKNLLSSFCYPEEFKSLKTQILLKTKDSPNNLILITSPKPDEGKTFIVSNLAVSLGNSGKKVLIVDCDFYTSKIGAIFDVNEKYGYLDSLSDCNKIFHQTKFNNVWVAPPGGETLKNKITSDVFFSDRFKYFLNEAKSRWDYILIKAPPALAAPDAKVLENYCGSVILVIESGANDPVSVSKIFNQLISGKPDVDKPDRVIGVVINKMDRKYKEIEYRYYQQLG